MNDTLNGRRTMWALEYNDAGEWVELAGFDSAFDALERGEEEELSYSFAVEFRVVRK